MWWKKGNDPVRGFDSFDPLIMARHDRRFSLSPIQKSFTKTVSAFFAAVIRPQKASATKATQLSFFPGSLSIDLDADEEARLFLSTPSSQSPHSLVFLVEGHLIFNIIVVYSKALFTLRSNSCPRCISLFIEYQLSKAQVPSYSIISSDSRNRENVIEWIVSPTQQSTRQQ